MLQRHQNYGIKAFKHEVLNSVTETLCIFFESLGRYDNYRAAVADYCATQVLSDINGVKELSLPSVMRYLKLVKKNLCQR